VSIEAFENVLQVGSTLDNRYKIESVLGEGGFGITYKAHDKELDYTVVIKEFLPQECAARAGDSVSVQPRTNRVDDYDYGLQRFLEEARILAKFQHPNIVRVSNFLKANGTAYFVMDYAEGIDLSNWLKKRSDLPDEKTILQIIIPILKGLVEVHKAGLMHRDIKPGNIFLRKKGGPLLIDFGSARHALGEHSKSISSIISQGYAPLEQYTSRGKQGPYTDLYAIGATLYQLITGKAPVESADRSHEIMDGEADPLTPAIEVGKGKVSDWLLQIIDQLLVIPPKQRPQSAESVIEAIQNKTAIAGAVTTQAQPEKNQNKTRVIKNSERFEKTSKPKTSTQPDQQTIKSKTGLIATIVMVIAAMTAGGWWFNQPDSAQINTTAQAEQKTQSKNLARGKAILYVNSQPEGVAVYLDNIKIGQTPYKGDALPSGKHQLKLVHDDYQNETAELNLQDNIILKKSYTLKPASGNLSVFSEPEDANIYIDGKDTKQTTPSTILNIKAGTRKLKLHKDKYYDLTETIKIKKGDTIRSDYTLKGGDLVIYKGEWIELEEKDKRVVEAREQQAAKYRHQAKAKAQQGKVKETQALLGKVKELTGKTHTKDKEMLARARKTQQQQQQQQRIERLTGKMLKISGGSFQMGSNKSTDEKPIHRVNIKAFKLGQYEVTQKQWQAVMGDNPSKFTSCDNCPVESVSWNDIQAFLKKLNKQTGQKFRLPTEAEWEYACRSGGKDEKYCGGNNENSLAWYGSNSGKKTHAVGQKSPNGLGLYDMSGNVWEWVQDCWNSTYNGAPSNGSAWNSGDCKRRVLRGSSWFNGPFTLRSAYRYWHTSSHLSTYFGFRLAQD